MKNVILLDFGSTFTKLSVVDCAERRIVYRFQTPSTVRSDAGICLEQCFAAARRHLGETAFESAPKLASSSAAGGLRMAVIGLSRTLSATAARNAAFGAGAKIVATYVGRLDAAALAELQSLDVEIVLFCGGYEKGSVKALHDNARLLAASGVAVPIIYAGNNEVASEIRATLQSGGKSCFIAPNIIPAVGMIDAEHTEALIRNIFLNRIVNMKGLAKVQSALDGALMPTPAAVLEAGELLSRGTVGQEGEGPLMIIDIGGATTDIHTYVEQSRCDGARLIGSPEPYAKRTVEGDMGMRESSVCLAEEIGWDAMAERIGISTERLREAIATRIAATEFVPGDDIEQRIDDEIAGGAVQVSARRHAGYVKHVHSSNCRLVQYGKNASTIRTVIGTGGILVHRSTAADILANACRRHGEDDILLPRTASFWIDGQYSLYVGGLLKEVDEGLALSVMKNSMRRL